MPPASEPFVTRLADGTWVQVRPLAPDDRAMMKEGLEHVGGRSLYERFLSPNHKPTEHELDYLTHPDQTNHLALALGTLDAPPVGIGVARCVRERESPDCAEYAILIRDDFHGRGAGTLHLAHLAEHALARGIERFAGLQLAENDRILKLTEKFGALESRRVCEPGVLETIWRLDPEKVRAHLGVRQEPTSRWKAPFQWFAARFSRESPKPPPRDP